MPLTDRYRPDVRWTELRGLHDAVRPAQFPAHTLRWRNDRAAAEVGLDALTDAEWVDHLARFVPVPHNLREPLALRYHGHQFGMYNAGLGDGRGFLYAQLRDPHGRLLDLGTKGSGTTPWSRGGDGRLTLQGGVREILAAELLEARGVSTCRTLSVVETGEELWRSDEPSPTRSCVLVRLSHGHVRIGTFQRLAFSEDRTGIASLVSYCGRHLLPELGPDVLPVDLLRTAGERLLRTCAAWLAAGFVHGVLNTDNLSITGESFDYGPWRFLVEWDEAFTAAYFDAGGLYAFGRQPWAVGHGLRRLAECLGLVADPGPLEEALRDLESRFPSWLRQAVLARLGLESRDPERDAALADACLAFLATRAVPVDRFFHDWRGGVAGAERAVGGPAGEIYRSPVFDGVRRTLTGFAPVEGLRSASDEPVGLPIDDVRALWAAIADHDDWTPLHARIAAIRSGG